MKTAAFTILFVSLVSMAFATTEKKQAIIRLQAPSGYADETTVYFDLGISPAFIASQDAPEVFANIMGVPSIYSFSSDNVQCSINGYSPLTAGAVIPLGIRTDTIGGYLFTASLLSGFDSTTIVQLEDRQENIFINLSNNFYAVQLNDTGVINGRFFLHVSRAVEVSFVTAGCANNDGIININADSSITWSTAVLYDTSGTLVQSFNNALGTYNFNNLTEGNYKLVLFYGGNYVTTMPLYLNGNYIVAHIQSLPLTAFLNQEITFHGLVNNATTYFWDFGDGSQINGIANPTFAFLQPGVFTVLLVCTNTAGCQYSDSVTITVSNTTGIASVAAGAENIWAYSKTVTVVLNEDPQPGAGLKIYNLLGQSIYDGPIAQLTSNVALNSVPDGYYIVWVKNGDIISEKKINLIK
jgi:PKD repeat protein